VANYFVSIVLRQEDKTSTEEEDFGFFLRVGYIGRMVFFRLKVYFLGWDWMNGLRGGLKSLEERWSGGSRGSCLRLCWCWVLVVRRGILYS